MQKRLKRKPDHYSPEKIAERWSDLDRLIEFLPTDRVLDMGAGEGVVALELARKVAHIHAVELKGRWVERAREEAARRKLTNVTFEQGSAIDFQPAPYDVILLLDVLNKSDDNGRIVGLDVLDKLLQATRRMMILRYGIDRPNLFSRSDIEAIFEARGFDCSILPRDRPDRGNLIVGLRART